VPATRLSRHGSNEGKIWALARLAWHSLLAASTMLVASSCILAPPPEYRDPVRSRPLLEVYKAVPSITDIVVWSTGMMAIPFTIPVRSEDAGQDLIAYLVIDYGTGVATEKTLSSQRVPASTYDQSRPLQFSWLPNTSPGCHVISLVVAHFDSFLLKDQFHLDPAKAGDDAAIVSWWANINPLNDAANTLANCPQSGLPKQSTQ
jgi:hypothetical protein